MRAHPLVALLPLLLQVACSDLIAIGYECEGEQQRCVTSVPPEAAPDAAEDGDRGAPDAPDGDDASADAGGQDAQGPHDASGDARADAGGSSSLRNPSFELTDGEPGNLDGAGGTAVAPWMRCPGLVSSLEGISVIPSIDVAVNGATLEPTDGDTFLALTFLVLPGFAFLTQELTHTWPAEEPRSLRFDLSADGLNLEQLRLLVLGSAEGCPRESQARELLGSVTVSQNGEWLRGACIDVQPTRDINWLMLTAESTAAISLDPSYRVFVDNIRESTEPCPEEPVGTDGGVDAGQDAGPDAGQDAGQDAETEAGADADADADAGTEV